MKPLLSVKDLSLTFVKDSRSKKVAIEKTRAVNKLSYEIFKGECLAIVGESGCGKSASLLAILALHEKGVLLDGEIIFNDEALHQLPEKQMRNIRGKKIALIGQDPMNALNPTMKIAEQIAEAFPRNLKITKKEKFNKVVTLLNETGITNPQLTSQQYPFELSGGMLQRVAIALALAGEPEIIMADEPTTALDVTIQKQVLSLIKRIQVKNNMALILVSHDLAVVAEMADKVLVMYAGELFEEARVEEIFDEPLHPYTRALLNALPKIDQSQTKQTLNAIEGQPPDLSKPIQGCAFVDRCDKAMNICASNKPDVYSVDNHLVRCWLYNEDYLAQQGNKHAEC